MAFRLTINEDLRYLVIIIIELNVIVIVCIYKYSTIEYIKRGSYLAEIFLRELIRAPSICEQENADMCGCFLGDLSLVG